MSKIYLYHSGDNPMKSFYRNDCKVHPDFCFFSSRDAVNKHLYNQGVQNWFPESEDDIKWATEHIWVMSDTSDDVESFRDPDHLTSEVLAEFAKRHGDENITECDTDIFSFP